MKNKISIGLLIVSISLFTFCKKTEEIENLELIPVRINKNFEYINSKGKIIIHPKFSNASVFYDKMALVRTSGKNPKWGFIDENGKYLIKPIYKSATIFSENLAFVVLENQEPTAITKDGKVKFRLKDVKRVRLFKNGLAAFTKHDTIEKWGFIDKNGNTTIAEIFNEVSDFSENKCAVKNQSNKYGYINKNGKTIIDFQFDEASDFSKNTAIVYKNGKAGVINEKGNYIIKPQFTTIYKDGKNYLFEQNQKWGWCDNTGKIIINPKFKLAAKFNQNNLTTIKIDNNFGYIDSKGKIVISEQFDFATVFNNNLAVIEINKKVGFINTNGQYIIKPQFDGFSYDYLSYINTGKSIFSEVETDYFDIENIIQNINFETTEKLSFKETYSQIFKRFKIDSTSINQSQNELFLYKNKKINPNVNVNFALIGKPFQNTYKQEKQFMANNFPDGYLYQINLSGRAFRKSKIIFEKLKPNKNTLIKSGFIRENLVSVYKNHKQQIVITCDKKTVTLYILKPNYDLSDYIENISQTNVIYQ